MSEAAQCTVQSPYRPGPHRQNGFVYLFPRVPSTPYLEPSLFPKLAPIKSRWETILDPLPFEALRAVDG